MFVQCETGLALIVIKHLHNRSIQMTDSNLVTNNAILQKLVVFVFTAKHQRAVARILNVFVGKHLNGAEL